MKGTAFRRWLVVLVALSAPFVHAQTQKMIPVIRQVSASTSSVSIWNAYVRVHEEGGHPYVSLMQVANLLGGSLRWQSVSQHVDLSVRGSTFRFFYDSPLVLVNGQRQRLTRQTLKNSDGFWVPAMFFSTEEFYRLTKSKLDLSGDKPKPRNAPRETSPPTAVVGGAPVVSRMSPQSVSSGDDVKKGAPERTSMRAIRRIVLDPGHGGRDPGAVGPRGTEEKVMTLLIAQELADILREKEDYEVLMTRMDDSFVPLEDRARLANKYRADLFISIHCNASVSSKLRGFEVYFLSEKASDPHADAVARFENAPLALEGREAPSPRSVSALLRSLVKTANINESSELGALVDRHVSQKLSVENLGVKQAGFYVLRGADMPAVLIETGFLSNPKEEHHLADERYRRKMAEGIVEAVKAYDLRKQRERGKS